MSMPCSHCALCSSFGSWLLQTRSARTAAESSQKARFLGASKLPEPAARETGLCPRRPSARFGRRGPSRPPLPPPPQTQLTPTAPLKSEQKHSHTLALITGSCLGAQRGSPAKSPSTHGPGVVGSSLISLTSISTVLTCSCARRRVASCF